MDRAIAVQLLSIVKSLDAPLNAAADLADSIDDVTEMKSIRRVIGEVGAKMYTELTVPILRQHPDLDLDRTGDAGT
ncbi:MAG TPA: hypothetical protein PKE27_15880 [Povalibacter sp.]|nr:hypothetical protein [Povalibacter sp.]